MVDNHGDRKCPKDRVSLVINGGSNTLNQPLTLTPPKDPRNKSFHFIFPTKYVILKSLKVSHWLSKY